MEVSFTRQVKEEITVFNNSDVSLQKALLSGFIKINSHLILRNNDWIITIKTENPKVAKLIIKLLKDIYQVDSKFSVIEQRRFIPSKEVIKESYSVDSKEAKYENEQKRKVHNNAKIIQVEVSKNVKNILTDLEIFDQEKGFDCLPVNLTKSTEAKRFYIMGCFLANGSVNSPTSSNYHLEIAANKVDVANYIIKLLKKFEIEAKYIQRRSSHVAYIKKSDQIADFLKVVGTTNCLFYFEDIRIQRDNNNSINRLINCEISNAQKAIETGNLQADAIRWYRDNFGLGNLDHQLVPIAQVRLANPEASYNELVDDLYTTFQIKISKPGLSYRMKKLLDYIDSLRSKNS